MQDVNNRTINHYYNTPKSNLKMYILYTGKKFSPVNFRPRCQHAGKFKTWWISMFQVASLIHKRVWANLWQGKTVCRCWRAKMKWGENNPLNSILTVPDKSRNDLNWNVQVTFMGIKYGDSVRWTCNSPPPPNSNTGSNFLLFLHSWMPLGSFI